MRIVKEVYDIPLISGKSSLAEILMNKKTQKTSFVSGVRNRNPSETMRETSGMFPCSFSCPAWDLTYGVWFIDVDGDMENILGVARDHQNYHVFRIGDP